LVLLDVSAAFDTLDHGILLSRFENVFGISGASLKWITSYLTDRFQVVIIDSEHSKPVLLKYGIPQGSVLGPKKYTMNSDKTEVILFTSKHNAIHMENVTVCFCDINITPMNTVRNLGVIFDSALNMEQQLNNICRAGYQQLRNIGHIRRYLTSDASKSLVNWIIISPLDYCNALLNELSQTSINKLQHIQNTAALIVTRASRRSHITPILKDLHWLPVKYRVQFKILMHTYKVLHGQTPRYISDMLTVY